MKKQETGRVNSSPALLPYLAQYLTVSLAASAIEVGDQIRDDFDKPFITVVERESFKRGTRIWVRLNNGHEKTFCAATTLVINKPLH